MCRAKDIVTLIVAPTLSDAAAGRVSLNTGSFDG
jgi:hypothetical protein